MCAKELKGSEGCKILAVEYKHRHKETGMRSHYITKKHDLFNAFYFNGISLKLHSMYTHKHKAI